MEAPTRSIFDPRNPVIYILLFGLALRLLFIWKGAAVYYGPESVYSNGDTFSYVLSFQNLIEKGHYTFDESIPDASFGRLPGFPFFYGLHYLIFGKDLAFAATAITQVLLDTLAILLIYLATCSLSRKRLPGLIAATLYATYPFIIVWVPIMGSELLANFYIVLYFYVLVAKRKNVAYYFLLGIIVCLAFYTREFLGIFVPITLFYFFISEFRLSPLRFFKHSLIFGIAFALLYLPWPIRNYLNHNRIMPVKTSAAGYASLTPDALGYFHFVNAWSVDNNYWYNELKKDTKVAFPQSIFKNPADAQLADSLVALGRQCGSGFYFRKYNKKSPYIKNCDEVVGNGFLYLAEAYKEHDPIGFWIKLPLLKLQKAVFKTKLINEDDPSHKQTISSILFAYRSILLLLGIAGLVFYRKTQQFIPVMLYAAFIYFYICFLHRSVEIRYFLQADVLLLIPASMLLAKILNRFGLLKDNKITTKEQYSVI